jgi:Holliday junction DNA helicase RuvA
MIAALHGRVLELLPEACVVDVHGVGYLVTVGARTLAELKVGGEARLHTHTYVREDALALYGFPTASELEFFKLLLSVERIGPKAALAILGRAELRVIKKAILKEDAALLATVPGIGPKTAARIVLELRGKVRADLFGDTEAAPAPASSAFSTAALHVLTGLGYGTPEAKDAIRAVESNGGAATVEDLVVQALKTLDRG